MSDEKVMQNGENVFPVFYKKKVLSLEKTKQLQEMLKESIEENEETMAQEKLMLDAIRDKDNKFIKRLEDHLESFKMAGIEKIILQSDHLPVWSQQIRSSGAANDKLPVTDDTADRMVEWYDTMSTYVSLQRDEVKQIINDWFSQLDKMANEGEPDPQMADKRCVEKTVVDSENTWGNALWYIVFILACAINIFIYYKPETIKKCVDDGFNECFLPIIMKVCAFFRDKYLNFHNIKLDYPLIALENSSSDNIVQYSSKSEL